MKSSFPPSTPLQTAVLFLVFNRPDTTAQVFEAIRKAKPPRLYVAADGPRADRAGEAEKAAKVNKAVSKDMKHTAQGKHAQKVQPVMKVLK